MPRIHIIAGPPGVGKTTFAKEYLPQEAGCRNFVDADLIAEGLSPFAPERMTMRAHKLMQITMDDLLRRRETFGFETTLRSREVASRIPEWRSQGYVVQLIFLSLSSAELSIQRVEERVRQGGHRVAQDAIRRRFEAGLENFHEVYKDIVDLWMHFDNSGPVPKLVDWSGA
ncbi:MAG: hypothetical protein RLZZ592_48 [Pseudomonadota bacterium]|jgi:predicted ABC-type ATPase